MVLSTAARDLRNGQYKLTRMAMPCTCGHTLGDHTAERDAAARDHQCLADGCQCSFFTKVRAPRVAK